MTSNRPLEDWGTLLGDVPSATAILDRFLLHAEIITLSRRSYRLRHQTTHVTVIVDCSEFPNSEARRRRAVISSAEMSGSLTI